MEVLIVILMTLITIGLYACIVAGKELMKKWKR